MDNKTPLWLDLKKEYIDDNFENLVLYLKDSGTSKDSFYVKTIDLLRERVRLCIEELSQRPLHLDEEENNNRIFNVRLLATWLLVDKDGKDSHATYLAMLGELRMLVKKFSAELLQTGIKSLLYERVSDIGCNWEDVVSFSQEVFAFKVTNNSKFMVPRMQERWWNEYGGVCATKERIYVLPSCERKTQKMLDDIPVGMETSLDIRVAAAGKDKLKQSQQTDLKALEEFTRQFLIEMKKSGIPKTSLRKLRTYQENQDLEVRITKIDGDTIHVETINPEYNKMQGIIAFKMKSLLYYYTNMFSWWLKVGDVIPVRLVDSFRQTFSLEKSFVDFIVNDCYENYMDKDYLSILVDTSQHEYVWLNSVGIPIYTQKNPEYAKGDFAYIQAEKCHTGRFHGKINGDIIERADETFVENEVREECIEAFARLCDDGGEHKTEEVKPIGFDPMVLKLLIRQLYAHQKHLTKPSERYKLLSLARIFAEMQRDEKAAAYLDFASAYLRTLSYFAKDENISNISIKLPEDCKESTAAQTRLGVVQLLQLWGKKDSEPQLLEYVSIFEKDMPALSRIARIIQTSNNLQEVLAGATLNVLKREIIKSLQMETDDESDFESENNQYLGVESGTVEFKQSIVFPPDNDMQPDEKKQLRNVLRGVCAFLNSPTGGTLYLGVSDQGYVRGIQGDLDFLKITSPDTYMRLHIQDPAKKLLGLDVLTYINMELMYDEQVVAIHVSPYPYRIVELEGVAYIRVNAESRVMNNAVRHQMLSRKVFTNQEKAANLASIQTGIQENKMVVLHNYASSNSGEFSDRIVEAYSAYPESNLVVCFDTKDNKCKCFNLSRIGYVEVLDKPWQYKLQHKVIKVDAFHMSGEKSIKCCLELDLFARNLLIEEYPKSKDDLKKTGDPNKWIYDTSVYNVAGIGRFVVGLVNHVHIIEAPELKEYIRNYFKECLTGF